MTEYIEREQLIGELKDVIAVYKDEHTFSKDFAATIVTDMLDNIVKCQPAADVAPVRHGRWNVEWDAERDTRRLFVRIVCSNCGLKTGQKSNYCPNCGAKMDLEVKLYDKTLL